MRRILHSLRCFGKSCIGGLVAFASIHVALAQTLPVTSAGSTPGAFDVSPTGQATYSIPLWTPPGVHGVEPKLSLRYSSNNRAAGWISPGWSLSGLSQITRCQKTVAQDGAVTPVYLTTDDAFCLDGRRLKLFSGSAGQPASTYRTEIEQFSLVTAKGTAGNGPAWFEVKAKDGLIYEYGGTVNSRATLAGGSTPYLWSLSKVRDRQGNNLIVDYLSSSGTLRPATIQYTQTPATGAVYHHTISFTYTSRDADDRSSGYIAGSQYGTDWRLASIDARYGGAGGVLMRQHRLTYADSPTTQRSLLTAVQECGGSAGTDCLAPTTISYQNGQSGIAVPTPVSGILPAYSDLRIVDLNGDGRSDLLFSQVASGGMETWWVSFAGPSGFLAPVHTGAQVLPGDNISEVLLGDFLGTGGLQLLSSDIESGHWCITQFNGPTGMCSNAALHPDAIGGTSPGNEDARTYAAADIDGDGRTDLLWAATFDGGSYVFASLSTAIGPTAPSFGQPMAVYPIPGHFAGLFGSYGPGSDGSLNRSMDFNGDTREDVVLVTGHSTQTLVVFTARQLIATANGGGPTFATGPTLNDFFGWPRGVHWNDDSCSDMQFNSTLYISACNGSLGQAIAAPQGMQLDWNGDGRTDLLYPTGSVYSVRLSQSAGASAEVSTGIPYVATTALIPLDYDADGLTDLMSRLTTTGALGIGLHRGAGTLPDLVSSVVDGYGNRFSPTYKPITQSNYTASYAGAAASAYPNVAYTTPLYVVDQFSASDGTGGSYTNQFHYWSARRNLRGQGFLGFAARRVVDSRDGLYRYEEYLQGDSRTGRVKAERVLQPDNVTLVQSVANTHEVRTIIENDSGPITDWRISYFPYLGQSTTSSYEVGGLRNGALISTREITNTYDVWGTLVTQSVRSTEAATGLNSGAVYTEITNLTSVLNDTANWCLSKPQQVQHTRRHSLSGGADVTRTVDYSWDAVNCRSTQEIIEPTSSAWAVTTDYGFDPVGNINAVTVTPAPGQGQSSRTYAIDWGSSGRFPLTVTNPKNQVTTYGWDEARGVRTSIMDANNLTTSSTFDNFNRQTRELRPDGTATDVSFHNCSSVYVHCAAADVRTYLQVLSRDTANSVIRTDIQSFDSIGRPRYTYRQLLGGGMSGEIATYNSRGSVSSVSMPFIQGEPVWYTSIGYDALGRPSTVQRPISEANSSTHLTQFSYQGLSTVVTDASNRPTTRWANAIGGIVRVVDAGNGATNYEYDAFDNLLKVRDPAGNETSMSYNVRGMKMTSTDPDAGAWTYNYFPLGEVKLQTDAKTQNTTFSYDELSRLLTRVDSDGTREFTYDSAVKGVGQRATATSPGYSEAYSYDTFGRLSQTRITADSSTYQYDYGYHPTTGLLQYLTYPTSSSGFRFKVRYDYQYGLVQKVSNYSGDVLGSAYWESVATNARGQYIDEQYGNGLRTISGYDRIAGWLDDRTTGRSGSTSLQNFTYQWDALGNLTQRRDSYNNTTENFYYDALDRLDYSTLNGTTNLDLTYDAIGNITSKSGVGSYTYHPTKRHAVVSTAGTVNNTFAYDANGNMETRNGQPITWYRNNLPKKINASATLSNEFWYGPDNARWKQVTVNGSSTGTWTYIGGLVVRLVTSTVNEFRHDIYGPKGVVAVYKRSASGTASTTYVTTDHLGSLDVISNTAGVEIADAAFSAFGERVNFTGSGPPAPGDLTDLRNATRRGFTFHEHVDDSGLIHMNGRVYDPVIARFISADPFVQDPFNSQSLNRYSYVLNNPLRYTDPTGYWSWDDIGDFFGGIGGGLLGNVVGLVRWARDFYRETPCSGTLCGQGPPNPPASPPPPTPAPPTFVRPADPTLPPADTAVPGMGQPADAVSTVGGDYTSFERFIGEPFITVGRDFGSLAAYLHGLAIEDEALKNVAIDTMRESRDTNTYLAITLMASPRSTPSPALRGSPYHPESVAARVRPAYRPNPAHDARSPLFNPRKTPEPADALSVYQGATRADMGIWYGRGSNGWYRYSSDNAGGVHFSGVVPAAQVPAAILRAQ